jgi:hypothetical protein
MQKQIIGIVGLIGSGKDTIADYLVNFHGYRRDSFAGTLKDAVSTIFGWDRDLVEGRTSVARQWREQVDEWWAQRLNIPDLTPRYVLQQWGTEVVRKGFHDDTWIASLENKLRNSEDDSVITDCRFPNEVKMIKDLGGKVLRVKRGEDPEWYEIAIEANRGDKEALDLMTNYYKVHVSEWAWAGAGFNYTVHNNGSIDELYDVLKSLVVPH